MRAEDSVRLRHMIDAAESALRFIQGRNRTDLDGDEMLLFALVRAVEIIGEAARKVSDEGRAKVPHVALGCARRHAQPFGSCLFRHRPGHSVGHGDAGSAALAGANEIDSTVGVSKAWPLARAIATEHGR